MTPTARIFMKFHIGDFFLLKLVGVFSFVVQLDENNTVDIRTFMKESGDDCCL